MNKPGTYIKQDKLWAARPVPSSTGGARELTMLTLCILITGAIFNGECLAGELPEWVGKIRKDHPRLFFDSETWPEVRKRALGPEQQWYHYIKGRVDSILKRADNKDTLDVKEYGQEAAWAAFVYRVTKEERYLDLAKKSWMRVCGSTMSASAIRRA